MKSDSMIKIENTLQIWQTLSAELNCFHEPYRQYFENRPQPADDFTEIQQIGNRQQLVNDYKSSMPTIEEIEEDLEGKK